MFAHDKLDLPENLLPDDVSDLLARLGYRCDRCNITRALEGAGIPGVVPPGSRAAKWTIPCERLLDVTAAFRTRSVKLRRYLALLDRSDALRHSRGLEEADPVAALPRYSHETHTWNWGRRAPLAMTRHVAQVSKANERDNRPTAPRIHCDERAPPPAYEERFDPGLPMKIWRLLPVDPHSEAWRGSTHKGPALVRAETARRARELATARFTGDVSRRMSAAASPWDDDAMVRAEAAAEVLHPQDGPEGVLEP